MTKRSPTRCSWPRRWLLFLAVLNTVTALGGAWGLVSGVLDLGPVTSRLPWDSSVVAGIALGLLVALPNAVLVGVALRRGRTTGLVGIAVGTAMVAWILVELAFIRELSFFHPLYGAIGLLMVWAGFRAVRVDLGVPAASLAHEVRDALADTPRFLAAPLMRRRHLRWGATDDEVAATLLGDDRQPQPDYVSTRALTPRTAFRVAEAWAPHALLWQKPDSTWAWSLTVTDSGDTRLVTRIRATHDRRHLGSWLASVLLLELGDYAMQRRMLLHLRERAERPVDIRASAGGAR